MYNDMFRTRNVKLKREIEIIIFNIVKYWTHKIVDHSIQPKYNIRQNNLIKTSDISQINETEFS